MRSISVLTLAAMIIWVSALANTRGRVDADVPSRYATTIGVGPSMYIPGSETALPGFALTIATPATGDFPLYVGADTGYYFDTGNQFKGYVPVLATMHIEFAPSSKVRPLLGISAGPSFGIGNNRPAVFGMMFKPGLNITLSNTLNLNIESRVGVLGSTFVFIPAIAASFAL